MRMRPPSSAPPETGLDGSTASTPTVLPSARSTEIIWSHRVLLPAPGAPVMPKTSARPACGAISCNSLPAPWSWFSINVAARASARRSPLRTPSAKSVTILLGVQNLARDHQPLNLAGAFADGAQLHVAIEFLHRVILEEAVPTMNLHGFIGHANRGLGGKQLGHRRLLVHVAAIVFHPRGTQRQQA